MVEHDFQALAARVTQLEDLVLLHTERLTQLIGYQKHIVGLLEWKETFQQPHPQDLEQPPKPVKSTVNPEPLKKQTWCHQTSSWNLAKPDQRSHMRSKCLATIHSRSTSRRPDKKN